jgi:hypothetical protein
MASENKTPGLPSGAVSAAPTPDRAAGGHPGPAAARERPGGSRLRPPAPNAQPHAPRLLGIDPAGAEHPAGPGDPDDESLVGRCWGCVCGWRGRRRDITARHFHPQVGDGGSLRRRRLARADRDARPELEAHLAGARAPQHPAAGPAGTDPGGPADGRGDPDPSIDAATADAERLHAPRPPRRRLTLPRAAPNDPTTGNPSSDAVAAPPVVGPHSPPRAAHVAPETGSGTVEHAGRAENDLVAAAAPPPLDPPEDLAGAGRRTADDPLSAVSARVRRARDELAAAEQALDAAVAAARRDGASWRSIGRATGLPHRRAAARWGPPSSGPSL